jgi:hypothetical protein
MKYKKIKRTLKQYCKKMKVSGEYSGRDENNECLWLYRGSFHTWNADFFTTPGYKTEEEAQAAIDRGDVDTQFINEPMR